MSSVVPSVADGDRTYFPVNQATMLRLPAMAGDSMGRVVVRPADPRLEDGWRRTFDNRSAVAIEVRRADCGAGCRCAGEVRLA